MIFRKAILIFFLPYYMICIKVTKYIFETSFPQGTVKQKGEDHMSEQTAKKELPACPVETTLTLIGDKWKVLILRDLLPGSLLVHFNSLRQSLSEKSLRKC